MAFKNDSVMTAWARLVRAHARVLAQVEAALKAADLPPLEWYDVLLELERGAEPMRARDLEGELLLAQYNLSRLLDRIEAKGLIARVADPEDGRSRRISITGAGKKLRAAMWPIYSGAVREALGDRVEAGELESLSDLLGRVIRP